jgi:molecular chaperone GrpE
MSDELESPEDGERDAPDGEEEQSGVYHLDLDEEERADVDELTREALEAVSRKREYGGASADEDAEREAMVAALEAEIVDLRDRSIRTLADFENFRKRAEREREESRRFAIADTVRDLLPVLDNLERALSAEGSVEDLKAGVEMVLRQLRESLRQRGVEEVKSRGEPFDPAFHEAVTREEDAGVAVPMVAEELQRGYTLHGRLLRPAMVRVAVPAPGEDERRS